MAGDGLRRPLNAPPGITPAPGVQPGVNQGVVVATRVIVVGPAGTVTGVFVYAPGTTPGPGNFPTAWMTTATTDPFGNVLPVAAVIGTTSIYAADGVFFSTGGAAGAAIIPNGSGGVNIQTTIGQYVNITTGPFASVAGTAADPTLITTDTPHAMALLNLWTTGARMAPQYQLTTWGEIEIMGSLTAPAGVASGQNVWAGGGYVPASPQSLVARNVTTNAAVMFSVTTAGDLVYQSGMAAGNVCDFHGFINLTA
jgi:hypothetical protein